jgi:hypothetical protein
LASSEDPLAVTPTSLKSPDENLPENSRRWLSDIFEGV